MDPGKCKTNNGKLLINSFKRMNRNQETEVLNQLKTIIDPDLGKDIVTCGFIKELKIDDAGHVSFTVELTTPACPIKEKFKTDCEKVVSSLSWVQTVNVNMSAAPRKSPLEVQSPGLQSVSNLLAVSSCKGGVGKSTLAINLAFSLAQTGAKIGIFDADIYGPSLPTIVQPQNTDLYQQDELIQPLDYHGVKLMSFGFIPKGPGSGAAIMRGPMVTQVINQLLTGTDWGELDYLVIDMPPGTGDIQLTLTQLIPLTAAIIVTTPQDLSFVDVVKGIQMFDKLKVPTVAVIENMSYFICSQCNVKHYPFGQGALAKLIEQYGFKNAFKIPIQTDISKLSDAGTPIVLEKPESTIARSIHTISGAVVREISKIKHGGLKRPQINFSGDQGFVITLPEGKKETLSPIILRQNCRCAVCIEEQTGKRLLDPETIPADIYPTGIRPMGNYAVAITWSDGHSSSIYPYDTLTELVDISCKETP